MPPVNGGYEKVKEMAIMKAVRNKTWLDTHTWGVMAFDLGHTAHFNGFKFKAGWNTCKDWNNKPECGGGFHLMTPKHNGFGFYGSEIRLVEYSGRSVALGYKVKVEKLRIVSCAPRILEVALLRCNIQAPKNGDTIAAGLAVILRGRCHVTQSGGTLWTYGQSQPRITQSGGNLATYGQSQPRITQSGGELATYGQSQPRITQSGGYLYTYDQSQPRITQSGGGLRTYGQSQPRITQSGGSLYIFGQSQPRITQSGGYLYTYGQSQPRITQSGGCLYTYDQSQPRITQSGGALYTCGQSKPRITRRSA